MTCRLFVLWSYPQCNILIVVSDTMFFYLSEIMKADMKMTYSRKLYFDTNCGKDEFDQFVEEHPYGSLLQESRWAEVKSNWDHFRIAVRDETGIRASALVLSRKIGLGLKLFYLPRGPLIDFNDQALCNFFFSELKKWSRSQRAAFIKIDPLIPASNVHPDESVEEDLNTEVISRLKDYGFIHHGLTMRIDETVQPRTQAVIDLSKNLKPGKKLKYYLKNADKKGVKVIRMKEDGVDLFSSLEQKTADRKNIALRSRDYFKNLMSVYGDNANISIAYLNITEALRQNEERMEQLKKQLSNPQYKEAKIAEINEQITSVEKSVGLLKSLREKHGDIAYISGALIIRSAQYSELLYAGMDEELSIFRSNTSFSDAVDWAKEHGCRYCCLGGVEGTLDDSLTTYKKVYSPDFISYIGEFDMPVIKPVYLLVSKLIPAVRNFHTFIAKRSGSNEQ